MRVFISDQADADLLQIIQYLAGRNLAAAESLAVAIDQKFESLAHFPFIERERSSLRPGLRGIVVGTHVIFYTVDPDHLTIVRILHGRRDIDAEFQR